MRSTGAKALGRLCAGLGESHFPDLIPWFLESLSGEGAAVERAGAAQGLSEVLSALGDAKVAEVLPTLIDGCRGPDAIAREGHAMLWVNLPAVLGKRFEPFLEEVVPIVLEGLADDVEPVRDAAMRGAQAMIAAYLASAAGLLLPPLQEGLADMSRPSHAVTAHTVTCRHMRSHAVKCHRLPLHVVTCRHVP